MLQIQTLLDIKLVHVAGRPIYRQSDGPNYLYFHKDKESKKGGVWVIDMTDEYEVNHEGLQVESSAGKPEDVSGQWQMASKDGRWVPAPKVDVGCGGKKHDDTVKLILMRCFSNSCSSGPARRDLW